MLPGIRTHAGMLEIVHNLEHMSRTLWDAYGNPMPLKVVLAPLVRPKEPPEASR